MAFAVSGFATVAQNFISRSISSNFYSKAPFLAILGALTIGNQRKNSLQIGRPNSAEILSGKTISPIEKKKLGSINSYMPRIQGFKTNNTKSMGVRDTMPTVANPTTNSHGQAMQNAAKFNWTHLKTPILVWHEDKERASQEGTKEGQGLSMAQMIDEATEVGLQDMVDTVQTQVWGGNPADQTADLWDQQCGVLQAGETANVYGNVDRSVGAHAVWRGVKDTVWRAVDVAGLLDDINLTKGLKVVGNGVNLLLTTTAIFSQFKAQILASVGPSGVMADGLPEFAQMGVKKEVLRKDNCYVMYDPGCPANTVAGFDLTTWKFMANPRSNFRVGRFVDISENSEGAKDADQAFVHLRYMLTCDNPAVGAVKYTAVGT